MDFPLLNEVGFGDPYEICHTHPPRASDKESVRSLGERAAEFAPGDKSFLSHRWHYWLDQTVFGHQNQPSVVLFVDVANLF